MIGKFLESTLKHKVYAAKELANDFAAHFEKYFCDVEVGKGGGGSGTGLAVPQFVLGVRTSELVVALEKAHPSKNPHSELRKWYEALNSLHVQREVRKPGRKPADAKATAQSYAAARARASLTQKLKEDRAGPAGPIKRARVQGPHAVSDADKQSDGHPEPQTPSPEHRASPIPLVFSSGEAPVQTVSSNEMVELLRRSVNVKERLAAQIESLNALMLARLSSAAGANE